jgi:amphi-Trp domain-containing protein
MNLLTIETEANVTREEAAARLREVADALASNNVIELEHEGKALIVRVPDRVELEIELELEDGVTEFEISLAW